MGYVGIPALIFIELNNFGRGGQTHAEMILNLYKIYGYLRGYLPIKMEADIKHYNETIAPLLLKTDRDLQQAWDLYSSSFEGVKTCNPDEKIFLSFLFVVFIDLINIAAISRAIDKQGLSEHEFEV